LIVILLAFAAGWLVGREQAGPVRSARAASFELQRYSGKHLAAVTIGTGFLISHLGLALTAYHVVRGGKLLIARFATGPERPAQLLAFSTEQDLALIQIDLSRARPDLRLRSTPARIGAQLLAIGNARGAFLGATFGRLLAKHQPPATGAGGLAGDTLLTDLPLRPGDSGGPVLASGEVVGISDYIVTRGSRELSYAISVHHDLTLIARLIRRGTGGSRIRPGIPPPARSVQIRSGRGRATKG
jgi:S1-C subfamily serine protease